MARTGSFKDQYWQQFRRGAFGRTELQLEHFTEFSAFTGTDIKAFILPDGDEVAAQELRRRLRVVEQELVNEQLSSTVMSTGVNQEVLDDAAEQFRNETFQDLEEGPRDILPLINLQSITVSTFRAKRQVRALGHVNPRGLARGSRTVAGTFILTELDRDAFWDILGPPILDRNVGDTGTSVPDQMRPFDVMLLFAHELGNIAIRHIYGMEIVTNGVVYSVQDYYSENTVSYIATDCSPLIPLGQKLGDRSIFKDLSGSRLKLRNLISSIRGATLETDYANLVESRNPFR